MVVGGSFLITSGHFKDQEGGLHVKAWHTFKIAMKVGVRKTN